MNMIMYRWLFIDFVVDKQKRKPYRRKTTIHEKIWFNFYGNFI